MRQSGDLKCAPPFFTVFIPKKNLTAKMGAAAIFISTPYTSFTVGAGSTGAIIVPAAVVKLITPVLCTTRFFLAYLPSHFKS